MAKPPSEVELQRVYHHMFLPPQLPQQSEDTTDVSTHLTRLTLDALRAHLKLLPNESSPALRNAIIAIENLSSVNSLEHGATSESELLRTLTNLAHGHSAPVFIRQQNAAVLVTRQDDYLIFETFELSPSNSAVLSERGRLIRCFPGSTIAVDTQQRHGLLKIIAETLASMSHSPMPGMQPETIKSGAKHEEHRDTTHPGAVTELFVGFLRGFGAAVEFEGISKNTRDDVLWTDALAPWRRSPMWLLIKVILHLLLSRASSGSELLYKRVMLSILGHVVDLARECAFPADCLYAMSAKIIRRLHKLNMDQASNIIQPDELRKRIDGTLQRTSVMISGRWRKVQKKDARSLKLKSLGNLKVEQDTYIQLPALDSYIKSMQSRPNTDVSRYVAPTTPLIEYDASVLPLLPEENYTDYHRKTAELQQFERWIEQKLDRWLRVSATNVPNACLKFYELMVRYHDLASSHYSNNPEGTSVMILTMFELWVACDKVAVKKCSMLSEYAPGVLADVLQCLLLPYARQMERLLEVETYLQDRTSNSRAELAGLLFSTNNRHSFGARYYSTSKSHQELLQSIESEAKETRKAKEAEFHEMQSTYERLDAWYEQEECEYRTFVIDDWCDPPETESRHMKSVCKKCLYREERDSLMIEVHEWPLPEDSVEASVVAFELKAPSWYAYWRDCRSYLLQNVLRGTSELPRPHAEYLLCDDLHLLSHYVGEQRGSRRIRLLSEVKPQVNTHYKMKGIATMDVSKVCVKNGARYRYHDKETNRFVGDLSFEDDTVARSCTYTLPIPALQGYIFRPASNPDGKSPNSTIASQSSCPDTMSLEEYKELSSVPLGHHIQWANILLQLTMPGVDFRKEVTTLVFWQCIYQTGPSSGDVLRETHALFEDESRALDLMKHLDIAVERIKRNWESAQALSLFSSIAARVMSLNIEAKSCCFSLLAKISSIAMTWLHSLRELACNATEFEERTLFISKGVEVALICASTFDVEDKHMAEMLSSTENASTLVQVAIVVQQGDSAQNWKGRYFSMLRLRFTRLLHRCYKSLAGHHEALDDAIKRSWAAYTPCATGWSSASAQADHWVMTETKGRNGTSMLVRYDLLSGELLVNGMPVDQPPPEYHTQLPYKTLFGTATVEVMPATSRGFRFSTKRTFREHEVQLGLRKNVGALIVQASYLDEVIENVPSEVLAADLPQHFIDGYVHWYNTSSGNVEFRPIEDPWNPSSPASWTLQKTEDGSWKLVKDGSAMVGLQSPTAKAITEIFKPLTSADRIHCILQPSDRSLRVDIPVLRLGFSLARGDTMLRSKEYRSMAVDEEQELGTLVGFKNKLLLKAKNGDRLLLLAEGKVVISKQGAHVNVSVSSIDAITAIHAIRIDRLLHRLVDNGDLGCKFYTAYLHALTSFCLPDPFTYTTGTEQALNILNSSAVRSFERLSQANVNMLSSVAGLCPGRTYYPADRKVMQSVKWHGKLGFLAQHARLRTSVQAIFDQAKQAEFYYSENENKLRFPALQQVDQHLQQRDNIRASTFRVPGYGAEDFTMNYDRDYESRDFEKSLRGKNAAPMSGLMIRNDVAPQWPTLNLGRFWAKLYGLQVIHGRDAAVEQRRYRYDGALVQDSEFDFVLKNFPVHHSKLAACQLPEERYSVAIWLATLAFAKNADVEIIQVLAMLCKRPDLLQYRVPSATVFDLKKGKNCTLALLKGIIDNHALPFEVCPEAALPRKENEYLKPYNARRHTAWREGQSNAVILLAAALEVQWPRPNPTTPVIGGVAERVNIASAMRAVEAKFQLWYNNGLLYKYLDNTLRSLDHLRARAVRLPSLERALAPERLSPLGHYTMEDIFSTPAPVALSRQSQPGLPEYTSAIAQESSGMQQPRLESLLQALDQTIGRSKYETSYTSDLRSSLDALLAQDHGHRVARSLNSKVLKTYRDQCEDYVGVLYQRMVDAINSLPNSTGERTLQHWPRISPMLLLQQLAHGRTCELSNAWKTRIVDYGTALTALQRAERLLDLQQTIEKDTRISLQMRNKHWEPEDHSTPPVDLINELRNVGHTNWSPHKHPEYLLMEIESGIMIREVQHQIAEEMCDPSSGGNAVMQLNMGEGKSTVIIPMVATALADGSQLVRVVVAKPQSKQMAEMLISKFGGLLGRRIYYMPFSRSLKLDKSAAETMLEVLRQCRRSGGILLVQPEHILSFRLMAPECYIAGKDHVGKTLMATQDYFDEYSRDIVDESDENFSVRFELIYTMGTQQSIELSPDRWFLMQQILDLVQELAPMVAKELPLSIEVHRGNAGAFPRVRLLRTDATVLLMVQVAGHIRDNGLRGFQMSRQTQEMREAVFTYITTLDLSQKVIQFVETGEFWDTYKTPILLLRGILAGGILAFALGQKRWRVNYGLASRSPPTKLAVPYRAKDSPSLRSEFSHPDVVITLTSLCYYYEGLRDEDMFTAFGHLMSSDQADIEYQTWVKCAPDVPSAFRQLPGVNLKDRLQCVTHVFPTLRFSKAAIDYFLSHIVFPKEMKQYPHKLSASGWDIGKKKSLVTTGFSGTNDSRRLLPLFVKQLDLEQQTHTNALVLEYLLQPDNGVELMPSIAANEHITDAERLLTTVLELDPPVQVILDVGAQILELDNLEVAKTWLALSNHGKEAVVYVNSSDVICVVDRKGRSEPLQTSPYVSRLDVCLAFLDESHTRGIDLKFPPNYRAAVTLGAHLTKDRLVQACMRMRKLGQGQTVVFCISQEIQSKIVEVRPGNELVKITVADVLLWSISETHAETRRSMPLWTVQGERFVRQEQTWQRIVEDGVTSLSKAHAEELLDEEAQSIDHRYRPRKIENHPKQLAKSSNAHLRDISQRCREFDGLSFNASTLQEEQERELSPETEAEREVPKPRAAKPADHSLQRDVVLFARSGVIDERSRAYMPAFESLKGISASNQLPLTALAGQRKLMVTADFTTTILPTGGFVTSDTFQRHIQWVLTRSDKHTRDVDLVMIISPYEANMLYPNLSSPVISLHLYKPRCNAAYAPLDSLDLFTVSNNHAPAKLPKALSVQLGLFAGQLYISSYDDYVEICRFLGLSASLVSSEMERQGWKVGADGFILSDASGKAGGTSGLSKSPVNFFKVLLSKIRRNGDGISKTDMGGLLDGKTFQKSHWKE